MLVKEAGGDERGRGLEGVRERAAPGEEVFQELFGDARGADFEDVQAVLDGDFEGKRDADVVLLYGDSDRGTAAREQTTHQIAADRWQIADDTDALTLQVLPWTQPAANEVSALL